MTDTPDLRRLGTCKHSPTRLHEEIKDDADACENWKPELALPELLENGSQFEDWVIEAARQILAEIALEKPRLRTSRIAEIIQAARGSSPASSPALDRIFEALRECGATLQSLDLESDYYIDGMRHPHVKQRVIKCLADIDEAFQLSPLREWFQVVIEKYQAGVTGNEGKDMANCEICRVNGCGTACKCKCHAAPLASPAVVTPEQFYENWRSLKYGTNKHAWPYAEHADVCEFAEAYAASKNADLLAANQVIRRQLKRVIDDSEAKVSELEAQLQQARSTNMEMNRRNQALQHSLNLESERKSWYRYYRAAMSLFHDSASELERMRAGGKS